MAEIEQKLKRLFTSWSGKIPGSMMKLPGSGSYRSYYRIVAGQHTVLGVHNEDFRENEAFISFTNHFLHEGLPVPQILASDPENRIYLISDLGDMTLYQLLTEKRSAASLGSMEDIPNTFDHQLPAEVMEVYKKAIAWLPQFQVNAGNSLDYKYCYPRAAFDRQSMMWDLNYFKYYFLKLARIPFDEQELEDDFAGLCNLLLRSESDFFLYRDFQSRNIMVCDGEPYFIDYQGGRKGALQYDIASLLTDGKANIPMAVRDELLHIYLDKLGEIHPVDREEFLRGYHGFALIRILQALGAYGFRGYYENKPHFLQSIPFALRNLRYFREQNLIGFGLHTLMAVIDNMIANASQFDKQSVEINEININNINKLNKVNKSVLTEKKLTVTVYSFSYKKAIPTDESGNGGGFVFDCRALPNPGRFEEYRQVTGRDQSVIEFLQKEPAVSEFLSNIYLLTDQSVTTYLSRNFGHLMVSFGCTGGQHRSVYCAEALAKHLKSTFNINVNLIHVESHDSRGGPWHAA
jgi:aminoglycoside/choline kinase family phosphotransferase